MSTHSLGNVTAPSDSRRPSTVKKPSAFVYGGRLKSHMSMTSVVPTLDLNLSQPPRKIPFFIGLRVLSMSTHGYATLILSLITVPLFIHGLYNCLEILCILPIFIWGLVKISSAAWKLDLLRKGVAVIPAVVNEERGSVCECCGIYKVVHGTLGAFNIERGSVLLTTGGWDANFGRIKGMPATVSTLEHTDPESGNVKQFSYSSLPYQHAVVLYNPANPKKYVHLKDLPYGMRPDPITGDWTIAGNRKKSHVLFIIWASLFWAVWIFCIVWGVLIAVKSPHIAFLDPAYSRCIQHTWL